MRCIVEGSSFDIPVQDMKDGDLGEITDWGVHPEKYKGMVVQRYEDILIKVGERSGQAWSAVLTSEGGQSNCRVRLLKVGESIELVE